jgi:anionic cell wall polymer biosynthesis LytR-Cps2A-Psr (LCP) family protein
VAVGALLTISSGAALVGTQVLVNRYAGAVATEDLLGEPAAGAATKKVSDIKGPLNILLVGIDPRKAETRPLADSIMVAHVPAGLKQVFLFSMPRPARRHPRLRQERLPRRPGQTQCGDVVRQ